MIPIEIIFAETADEEWIFMNYDDYMNIAFLMPIISKYYSLDDYVL